MCRHLPRKRHVQPQNAALNDNSSNNSVSVLSGKRFRWFQKALQRRTRLLFSLLRRYPVVALFLALVIWKGMRLFSIFNTIQIQSIFKSPFQQELSWKTTPAERFRDDDFIEGFGQQHIHRLSNFREKPNGIFMDAQLDGAERGILKLSTRDVSVSASPSVHTPQVHKLAEVLHLPAAFIRSHRIRLAVALQEPTADRRTVKALCRACGFRSPTKVPHGTTVAGDIIPAEPSSLRFVSALRTPTIEPYDWTPSLPTSHECNDALLGQTLNRTTQKRCQRLTEIMIVMYLAGCAPPSSDAFVAWDNDHDDERNNRLFKMALPGECFGKYKDNSILLDILTSYVRKTCSLPSGLLGLNRRLEDVGWGVGSRAKMLQNRLVFLDASFKDGCRSQGGWHFYKANSG